MRLFGAASVSVAAGTLPILMRNAAPRRAGAALVGAALVGSLPWGLTPALAAGGSGFTVAGGPTAALNLPPGQPATAQYTVINSSEAPEQIQVQITGLHFQGETPEFTGSPSPGLSISARPTSITLAAGASQSVNLTAQALPGSHPGGLYAGIVFKELPPPSSGSTTIVEAQARPLIGHVPGPTTDTGRIVSFGSPSATAALGRVVFDLTFLDTGDIDYRLGGSMSLLTSSGAVLGTVAVPPATVLPGNQRLVPLPYSGPVPAGQVTGQLQLTWGSTAEHRGTAMATVIVSGPGPEGAHQPVGAGPGPGHQNITVLASPKRHATNWIFEGLALLLLLILIALLIKRYLDRRRMARRLQQEAGKAQDPGR